ncbi:MAG: sulfotransferase [Candidatus Binataceae bacterium]|nr:sulfotransferase [Candidatus Binataceae bacterium]
MAQQIWPNFFIVGTASSGTTSLYTYLKQHPEVFLPALKEPHYFAQLKPTYEHRYLFTYITEENDYLALFKKAAGFKAIGEASPSYLSSPDAPARIRQAAPDAKIIAILRDPVERAYSHYLMNLREGLQRRPFFEALKDDWERDEKGWGITQMYVELGMYAEQIRRYIRVFGRDRVLIVLFDDLKRSTENKKAAVAQVLRFIGADLSYLDQIDTSYAENSFGVARWPWVRRIAGSNYARRLGQLIVPRSFGANHAIKRLVFQRFFVKPAPRPKIDPAAKEWLCSIFDPDIAALEELLGRELPQLRRSWGHREPAIAARQTVAV